MTARSRAAATNGQAAIGIAPRLSPGAVFTGRAERDAEGRGDMAWFEAARSLMASRLMDGRCPRCGEDRGERRGACARCRSLCSLGCGRPGPGAVGLGESWVCGSEDCEAAWQKERRRCSRCGRLAVIVSSFGGPAQPCEIRTCGQCAESRAATGAARP